MGTQHQPHSAGLLRAGFARCGAATGCPGEAPRASARGVRGRALSLPQPPVLWAGGRGPLPVIFGRRGCGRGDPVPNTQRTLLQAGFARSGGGTRAPGRGRLVPPCGMSVVGHPPSANRLSLGQAAEARCMFAVAAGGVGVGTRHLPHSACFCELALRAVGVATGRPAGGASCLREGCPGSGTLPPLPARPWGGRPGPAARYFSAGGVRAWGPVTNPTVHALASWVCALWGWHIGAWWAEPRASVCAVWGGALCVRCALMGARTPHGARVLAAAALRWGPGLPWHLLPCRGSLRVMRASRVGGTRWPSLLGTCPCALVVAGGVPLWRASWPRVVAPRLIRSVRSRYSGRLCRRCSDFPHPGAVATGFTGRLRGVRGGWLRTGLIVPAAGPCRGRRGGLAPRLTRSGPRNRVVPGWSLRLRSWAACAASGWRVWTRSLRRAVSRTVCLSTGDSTGAAGLFCVDADTFLFEPEDATPGPRPCVPVCPLFGHVGRAGPAGAFWCASPFIWQFCRYSLLSRFQAWVALSCFFLRFFPSHAPLLLAPPLSPPSFASRPQVPLSLALFVFSYPRPLFFLCFLPSCALRPCSLWLWRSPVSGLGCPWPWRVPVSTPLLFVSFLVPPPHPSCVCCALFCLLLRFSVLRVVLWLPALCLCGLLRVVRCPFGRLSVGYAVLCRTNGCCCVLRRGFGPFVPLRCLQPGLLPRLGLCCRVPCCVPGCCAAPRCLVPCCAVVR